MKQRYSTADVTHLLETMGEDAFCDHLLARYFPDRTQRKVPHARKWTQAIGPVDAIRESVVRTALNTVFDPNSTGQLTPGADATKHHLSGEEIELYMTRQVMEKPTAMATTAQTAQKESEIWKTQRIPRQFSALARS